MSNENIENNQEENKNKCEDKSVGWVLTQLLTEKTKNKIKKIAKD